MKKTKTILAAAIIIAVSAVRSSSQSVSYEYVENDAHKSNFNAALHLFDGDYTSGQSITLGYGISVNMAIRKIASADFCFDKTYAPVTDLNYHSSTDGIYTLATTNTPVRYNHFEAGGMFHLFDRTRTKKRKITLGSSSSYRGMRQYTTTSYIRVPTEVRSIFGIRGGLYHYTTSINDHEQGVIKDAIQGVGEGGVIADDGTEFGGAVSDYNSPYYNTKAVTNMKVNGFYAGICSAQFYNVAIDADGSSKTLSHRNFSRFYLDAIIAPPKIDDFVTTDGKSHKVSGGNAKGFETRSVGARLGFEAVTMGKAVAVYYRIETGIKPGLAEQKYYINVGFGLAFRGKLKFLG
jgi:hypothetical protein